MKLGSYIPLDRVLLLDLTSDYLKVVINVLTLLLLTYPVDIPRYQTLTLFNTKLLKNHYTPCEYNNDDSLTFSNVYRIRSTFCLRMFLSFCGFIIVISIKS